MALAAWGSVASMGWCVYYARALYGGAALPWLERLTPPDPERWPLVSVVVPACNEADTLRPALDTLLGQDYPRLEVVVVDDRSDDATGRLVDELGAADPRIVPLHVRELPPGWLGKVHALHVGTRAARGEWLLYTDADVHYGAGALRRAVAWALAERLDHVTVAPELRTESFWLDVAQTAFGTAFLQRTRAATAGRPGSAAFVGVGAFNLVRRALFDRTPGFEWLRLEVLDDVGLGLMVARAGGRSRLALGPRQVEVTWYGSLRAMARGLEKNLFAVVGHYRLGRALLVAVSALAFVLGPLVALAHPVLAVRALGGLALLSLLIFAGAVAIALRGRFFALLAQPLGQLLLAGMLVHSAAACTRRRGVSWRGTTYELGALRTGQRVRL